MISLKIDLKDAETKFKNAPEKLNKAINLSLTQAGLIVQNKAKDLAPYKTGNLRQNITNKVHNFIAEVGSDVIYARVREYKTRRLPKGYLRPALSQNENRIEKEFEKNINNALK